MLYTSLDPHERIPEPERGPPKHLLPISKRWILLIPIYHNKKGKPFLLLQLLLKVFNESFYHDIPDLQITEVCIR